MRKGKKKVVVAPIISDSPPVPMGIHRDVEFRKFAEYCATPKQLREFKTQKAFALHFGLSQDSLSDWKKKPGFWQIFNHIVGIQVKEGVPDVLHALYVNASKGKNMAAVSMYLHYSGMKINSESNNKSYEEE